jgi:D-3-phosphoglycerate dehydrogenase
MVDTDFINGFAKPWIINTSRGKNIVTAEVTALISGKVLVQV